MSGALDALTMVDTSHEFAQTNNAAMPPFDLREGERIIARLLPAERQHTAWVHAVHTALICRSRRQIDALLHDGAKETPFGRWLNDETDSYIRAHPDFAAAAAALEEAHDRARRMLGIVAGGGQIPRSEYVAFADALQRFDKVLESILKELWDLLRYTDPLTGIATRFAMTPRLRQERERSLRTGQPCSVCMIDLDHFKEINDTHGHKTGDRVLTAVSGFLSDHLRRDDQVYRYGGEEFVLVLPDTDLTAAFELVERLRESITRLSITLPTGEELGITASFGIAPLRPREAIRTAIDRADLAMYAAKRGGRNRVELWRF